MCQIGQAGEQLGLAGWRVLRRAVSEEQAQVRTGKGRVVAAWILLGACGFSKKNINGAGPQGECWVKGRSLFALSRRCCSTF